MDFSHSKEKDKLLIKGGKIVNSDLMYDGDIYIENGIIVCLGKDIKVSHDTKILDATGYLVLPGGIDPSTKFNYSSMGIKSVDGFDTGTKAALIGGTTTILNYIFESESSLIATFDKYSSLAESNAFCDFGLNVVIGAITENTEKEMDILSKEKGINGFKFFMAGVSKLTDRELLRMFQHCKKLGAIAQIHAENEDIISMHEEKCIKMGILGPKGHLYSRPEDAESEAVFRCIVLANQCDCPVYISPVMSKSAADVIADKRLQGCKVFGETTTAALGANGKEFLETSSWSHAASFITSPPIRCDNETSTHLMKLLSCDSLQVTGSDNCSFNLSQKSMGISNFTRIPQGVHGCEERLSIIWELGVMSGIMDPCKFVAITSSNAAKIYNIYPRKGRIDVNSDADLVIFDPYSTRKISCKTHQYGLEYNLYEGMQVRGTAKFVILRGNIVVENGKHIDLKKGIHIPKPPFSPHVFGYLAEKQLFPHEKLQHVTSQKPTKKDHELFKEDTANKNAIPTPDSNSYSRPPTICGSRNQLDSSYNLLGAQFDEAKAVHTSVRVIKPPGDTSQGFLY